MTRKEQIQAMLAEQPNDTFLQYALALEIAKTGDINLAIQHTTALLKQTPDYLGAYYQLGQWHEALEDFDAAISAYQQGITVAKQQTNLKAKGELEQALWLID
jgi:tetratricopeptide (TPR) repeat protein